ncbi:sugar ABC transporter ATP-binding protein [Paraburkholderia graminis]|uniref:sugar ABC transporter ATP-binding protein n=1 Tax=Paraburkholderia graminis TaxID=60548 RepID=UPI0027951444|nr:sugar ABC transporter ATP-binding protein [Paraburkholderia graminis]MDQ0627112.1 sugar lactone lactonase YvrE [Paraburkholderia graminis]
MMCSARAWLLQAVWTIALALPCTAWPQSQTIATIAGNGVQGYAGDGGAAVSALIAPDGLAIDREGNIFVAESFNHVIRRIDHRTGVITTYAGTGRTGYNGDGLKTTETNLGHPDSIAISRDNDLYILDTLLGNRIWRVDHDTLTMHTVVGGSVIGYSGDGGPANAAVAAASSIAFDRDGNLVIGDLGRIRRVDRRTGIITTIVGDGLDAAGPASGPAAAAGLIFYITTAFDRHNEMFFADAGLNTVRKLDRRGATFTTVAGVWPGTTGLAYLSGYNGDGQPATQALLYFPSHIATDCAGNLTISDTANFRVRQVDDETGIIETIAGTGAPGFSGDGGLATQAMIEAPTALAFGRDGGLYFVTGNRIREITGLHGMHRWDCRDERHYHLHDNDRDGGQD